jgi:hypothetical protein
MTVSEPDSRGRREELSATDNGGSGRDCESESGAEAARPLPETIDDCSLADMRAANISRMRKRK